MKKKFNTDIITPRGTESIKKFLEEARKHKPFTPQEEVEAFELYTKDPSAAQLELITKRNLRFVISVAKQYINSFIPFEDLLSAGSVGLVKAIKKFDSEKGFKFSSYAIYDISAEIIASITNNSQMIRVPANRLQEIRKIEKKLAIGQDARATLTEEEICLLSKKNEAISSSYDTSIGGEEGDAFLDVTIDENAEMPDEELHQQDVQYFYTLLVESLEEREKDVLEAFYGINEDNVEFSIKEISARMKLHENTVRNIRNKAFWKMKRKMRNNKEVSKVYHNLFKD